MDRRSLLCWCCRLTCSKWCGSLADASGLQTSVVCISLSREHVLFNATGLQRSVVLVGTCVDGAGQGVNKMYMTTCRS